jgi:hypothetical protein
MAVRERRPRSVESQAGRVRRILPTAVLEPLECSHQTLLDG